MPKTPAKPLVPIWRCWPVLGTILVLLLAMNTGCSQNQPPNVILITLDTVRADALGCYGNTQTKTPQLDALAAEGVLYSHAYTPYPLTLPAHASMLTGLMPFEHEIRNNDIPLAADSVPLLQEHLKQAGYTTGAVLSTFVLDRRFGLARGFDHYYDTMPPNGTNGQSAVERRGDQTTDLALELLEKMQTGPFFLWVHYFDAHAPYAPPAPFTGQGYTGEINYLDQQIGRLLDDLRKRNLYQDAVIVVAGDHGEAFGEHGEVEHGFFVYDTTLHVPLLLKKPGVENQAYRVSAPASVADIMPTLLSLTGIQPGTYAHAQDLLTLNSGTNRELYAETLSPLFNHGASPLATLRRNNLKYIEAPQPELYQLETDAAERHNLFAQEPQTASELRRRLDTMNPLHWMTLKNPLNRTRADEATVRKLASLGYAATGAAPSRTDRPDPKEIIVLQNIIQRGDAAVAAGNTAAALAAYREVLALDPTNWKGTWKLAAVLEQQNDIGGATAVYESLIGHEPTHLPARLHAARLYGQYGSPEAAVQHLDIILKAHPNHTMALNYRGVALLALGQPQKARRDWERSLKIDPGQTATAQKLAQNFGPRED